MKKKIKKGIEEIIKLEGGYVNHENDYGGATKYGITEETAREYGYSGSMRDLPISFARMVYYEKYFLKYGLDRIKNADLAIELLEQSINFGPTEPIKRLQTAYNLLTGSQIAEDGLIGPETTSHVNNYEHQEALYNLVNILQGYKYVENVKKDESQRVFLRGWLRRVSITKQ